MTLAVFNKVAVMCGGSSAERAVSLRSGAAVHKGLVDAGVNAQLFDPAEQPLTDLLAQQFSCVMLMLHGRGGEDGAMQGALQTLGIPYTGAGVLGSALAMDKIRSKQIFQQLGLPTAAYQIARKSSFDAGSCGAIMAELGGAIMVKPALEGSSIGMAKVTTEQEMAEAITQAFEYDSDVLLEAFVVGEEYTVSILNDQTLPSIRLATPNRFYDYQAKYHSSQTQYHCPSGLSEQEEQHLATLSLQAFSALGATGWGRVDLMRDKQGQFYLLEANTAPGMTETSLVPKAAKQAGLSFSELCMAILTTAQGVR